MKRDNKSASPATPATPTTPPPPAWLSESAKETWCELAPLLASEGRLEKIHERAFTCYCTACGMMTDAAAAIARDGATVKGRRGGKVRHPACAVWNSASQQVLAFGKLFGLSPASRARLDKLAPVRITKPNRFANL